MVLYTYRELLLSTPSSVKNTCRLPWLLKLKELFLTCVMQSTISLSSFSGLNTVKFSCLSWTWFSNLSDEVICVLLLPGLKGVLLHDVINNETKVCFLLFYCILFVTLLVLYKHI